MVTGKSKYGHVSQNIVTDNSKYGYRYVKIWIVVSQNFAPDFGQVQSHTQIRNIELEDLST